MNQGVQFIAVTQIATAPSIGASPLHVSARRIFLSPSHIYCVVQNLCGGDRLQKRSFRAFTIEL
jgi:hypothetical protein